MGAASQQQLANQHRIGLLVHLQRHGTVEQSQVTHQQVQGISQRLLVPNQQTHRPHVGQQARARHAQRKAFVARLHGRGLQQAPHFVDGNHQIRLIEHTRTQARIEKHARAVQPRGSRHCFVIGQTGCADKRRHGFHLVGTNCKEPVI